MYYLSAFSNDALAYSNYNPISTEQTVGSTCPYPAFFSGCFTCAARHGLFFNEILCNKQAQSKAMRIEVDNVE